MSNPRNDKAKDAGDTSASVSSTDAVGGVGTGHTGAMTLRWKLTLWVIVLFFVVQGTVSVVVLLFRRDTIRGDFDEELTRRAQDMTVELKSSGPPWSRITLSEMANEQTGYVFIQRIDICIFDDNGVAIVASDPTLMIDLDAAPVVGPAGLVIHDGVLHDAEDDAGDRRFIIHAFDASQATAGQSPDAGMHYLYATSRTTYADRDLGSTRNILALMNLIGILAAGIAGWRLAGVAVQPLAKLAQFAGSLDADTIDERVDLHSEHAEMRKLEIELNKARDRLNEAYRTQERFILNVSHELKTPIAYLLTEAQVLRASRQSNSDATGDANVEQDDPLNAFIESVEAEMRRLGKTIESFLLLTQIREHKRDASVDVTPANDIVLDALVNCERLADQNGVAIETQLYDGDEELLVDGDPSLLRTMLDNLIVNAIRFTPVGEAVKIRVEATGDGDRTGVRIIVADAGPGIPESILTTLFDRFTQSDDEVERKRGSGLGLAIAQGIAELHGARLHAANAPAGGAVFSVILPLHRSK